ncbi:MAG TPA: hypothetical protein VD789_02920 [Thermomicrobiales bacterium]|nr:hypothetical protein [Thermomicrobiales bacterium]
MHQVDGYAGEGAAGTSMTRWAGALLLILVTVMFGGASLLRILVSGEILDDWQVDQFRAGHAHAGVLLILSLAYVVFLERTRWSASRRRLAMMTLIVGGVSQSGGFFLHMLVGEPESFSAGIALTLFGAVLLATAVTSLGWSLIRDNPDKEWTV